ncbi:DUF4838 domain-containing protein [Acidobacteriota bacterium]
MKHRTKCRPSGVPYLLILIVFLLNCGQSGRLSIVREGRSEYSIILYEKAGDIERRAAKELQKYLAEISGCTLEIIRSEDPAETPHILLASAGSFSGVYPNIDREVLEEDGFTISTEGKNLVLAGGTKKGVLYAVYTLLEDYLGCRKFSANVEYIPHEKTIDLPPIDRTDVPQIKHREVHMPDAFDDAYADWHKLDNRKVRNTEWGMWVHTFDDFIPPDRYFQEHPEYFSEINGVRVPDAQLCLTDPDVFQIVVDGLKERMALKPNATYWSVSQNDTYYPCQCRECRELEKMYGGPSGAILHFVNRVAREFPRKVISTLAYQYSRSAPRKITPEENVNIMLCTIELNRSRPIAVDNLSASFRKDIEDWGKLTDNIILWDYVVQFRNLIDPFPNLRVLKPNIRYFVDNNVRMMFQQGSGTLRSEFHELRTYIISKLLWNPESDVDAVLSDFIEGYYDGAGLHIQKYIDLMHNSLDRHGGNLGIYGYPWDGVRTYLSPELISRYQRILDDAEASIRKDSDLERRVNFARLPLEFAILEISKRNVTPALSLFVKGDVGWSPNPEMVSRLDNFVNEASRQDISRLDEHGEPPEEYGKKTGQFFLRGVHSHLAVSAPVTLLTLPSEKYPVGGAGALTDGLKGSVDFHCNWLGFEGSNMNVVVDLEHEQKINSISVDFIQDLVSWIWIPNEMDFYVSLDGLYYDHVSHLERQTDERIGSAFVETFRVEFEQKNIRYVKIVTQNYLTCPPWHKGADGLAWIFADEIVIE